MRIIYTIADLQPESGGPSRSVSRLAESMAATGANVDLIALSYQGRKIPIQPAPSVRTHFALCSNQLGAQLKWTPAYGKQLRQKLSQSSNALLHDSGVWLPTNSVAGKAAREYKVPFVLSPRGMLTAWSLQHHGWKKKLAWSLYQKNIMASATLLHATSTEEAIGLRQLGLLQPIVVIPNGVDLPPLSFIPNPLSLPKASTTRTALFLSRIHPKKGLMNLLQAWSQLQSGLPPLTSALCPPPSAFSPRWRLLIVGPDEGGHLNELKVECGKLKLEGSVEFRNEVGDKQKWELMAGADLFVLPTHSENFGIVIAEALACGVPVITTKGTPWQELEQHQCGWWIDIGIEPLTKALREALALSDTERSEMGKRGRKLVEENYSWISAAQKMKSVYEWLLGKAEQPGCVQVAACKYERVA